MTEWKPPKFGSPCWLMVAATDVKRASEFYETVFNWSFKPSTTDYPAEKIRMFEFRPDVELSGGITKGPDEAGHLRPGHGGFCMCWLVEDVRAIADVIEKAGGKVLSDVLPEGKTGLYRYFEDTEGNLGSVYQISMGATA
ncbi:hypothetical protein GQ53DRAFT_811108 [Thozetella sp. PMI_491]|nr:hypothetical protein GQ53DRAFT_811108 [Thozetella sp. PMI_491]